MISRRQWTLGGGLIVFAILLSAAHYWIFRDLKTLLFYLFLDIAFIPLQLLIVTLVLEHWLQDHERRSRRLKLNNVVGTFFSECGVPLLRCLKAHDATLPQFQEELLVSAAWPEAQFFRTGRKLQNVSCDLRLTVADFIEIRQFLLTQRDFLLRLLENPNLLEHESVTELLLAVFHLLEELTAREPFGTENIPEADAKHLVGDTQRAYRLLLREWLTYMAYLKVNYPFLFSFAVRTNPFDPRASVTVQSG